MRRPVRDPARSLFLVAFLAMFGVGDLHQVCRAQEIRPAPLRPEGVTPAIESSITRGLRFLAANQQSNGSYGASRWRSTYPTAMSALVGLAFLSSGSTPTRGPYAKNIQGITKYLLANCTNNSQRGLLSDPNARESRPMYSHGLAMTYLAQIFGLESDRRQRERIRKVLQDAIGLSQRSQTSDGGWGYRPSPWDDDEGTLTVTQLQGLRACRDAGIVVPKNIIDGAVSYIELSTNASGSVRYSLRGRQETRPGVACAAVVTLWNAGRYKDPTLTRIVGYVDRYIRPNWSSTHHAEYVMYYLAQAKFVLGGKRWEDFYRQASGILLAEQNPDGHWEGADAGQYGDIYGTAIALLALQLPFNRLSVYQR